MAIMATGMAQKVRLSTLGIFFYCANFAFAGDWQFDPSIKIDETYSDNVGLTATNEISSLVSQTSFNMESSYKAQNAQFNFSSQSTYALYSHNHDVDNDFHTVASNLRLQLWPNGMVLFGSVNISNQSRNGSRNALADIVSADTVRVETYHGGVEYNIDNSDFVINSSIGYRQTTSEDSIGDREGIVASFSTQNGKGARHVFWDIANSYQEQKNNSQKSEQSQTELKVGLITAYKINPFVRYYDEDNSGNLAAANRSIESNSYGLGVRWLITPRLQLDTAYNKPIGDKLDINGVEQEEYVNAELTWQPSIRTKIAASYSERFFGDSYGLNLSHKNRRLTNTISYVEDVQTFTRNNFVSDIVGYYFCPVSNISSVDECALTDGTTVFPSNPNTPDDNSFQIITIQDFTLVEDNVFSLNKTFSWNSTLELPRTTITLNANQQKRENLDSRVKDQTSAASFGVHRKVSGRSTVGLEVSYNETQFQINTQAERIDRYRRYQVSYEKYLNSALSFNLALSYLNRNSGYALFNYQEGRISANITKGF